MKVTCSADNVKFKPCDYIIDSDTRLFEMVRQKVAGQPDVEQPEFLNKVLAAARNHAVYDGGRKQEINCQRWIKAHILNTHKSTLDHLAEHPRDLKAKARLEIVPEKVTQSIISGDAIFGCVYEITFFLIKQKRGYTNEFEYRAEVSLVSFAVRQPTLDPLYAYKWFYRSIKRAAISDASLELTLHLKLPSSDYSPKELKEEV